MTHQTQTFTIADPRTFDGDPYEVAERAVAQAEALAKLLDAAIQDAYVMTRNAELERQLLRGEEADPAAWEGGPHGKSFDRAREGVINAGTRLRVLRRGAGFNPKGKLDG